MPPRNASLSLVALELFLGATLLLPLVVVHGALSPYAFSRAMILRILVAVAVPALLLVWRRIPESRPAASPLLAAGAAYLLYYSLNPFLGADPLRSMTSDLERSEGVFALWTYCFLFLAWLTALRAGVSWQRFARIAVVAGTAAVVYALLFSYADVTLSGAGNTLGQIAGTLANPAFFAAYALLLLTVALMLFAAEREERRWIPGAAAVLFLGALLWAQNRGTLAGILAAAVAAIVLGRRRLPGSLRAVRLRTGTVVAALSLGVLVAGIVTFGRFQNLLSGVDNSLGSRLVAWRGGIEASGSRPLFGWGTENFLASFYEHHPPELWRFTDEVYDRAHNEIVEHMVSGGAVGLLALLALLAAIAWTVRRALRQDGSGQGVAVAAGAGLLAYGVSLLFLFPVQAAMFLVLSVLAWLEWHATRGRGHPFAVGVPGRGTLAAASGLAAIFALVAVIQPFSAAILAERGRELYAVDQARSVDSYAAAIRIGSSVTREAAKDLAMQLVVEAEQGMRDKAVWGRGADLVVGALRAEAALHPWYPSPVLILAMTEDTSSRIRPAALTAAVAAQEEALRRDPFNLDGRYRLALLKTKASDGAGAMGELREAVRRAPTSPEAWKFLALGSGLIGDREAAMRAFERSLTLSRSGSPGGASLEEEEAVRSALMRLPLMRPVPSL